MTRSKDYRLGMLAAARIAENHTRELRGGLAANRGAIKKMRKAGKNVRSGENAWAFQHHNRMGGYFLDKALTAQNIAQDIRDAARRVAP